MSSRLKAAGVDAELVTEYAKDKVWEEHDFVFRDQCYIFGHQHFRMARVCGKVDVVVTDSPLPLSAFYDDGCYRDELAAMARKAYVRHDGCILSYFLRRVKNYSPNGRFQTEAESDAVSVRLRSFVEGLGTILTDIPGSEEGYDKVVSDVFAALKGAAPPLAGEPPAAP